MDGEKRVRVDRKKVLRVARNQEKDRERKFLKNERVEERKG